MKTIASLALSFCLFSSASFAGTDCSKAETDLLAMVNRRFSDGMSDKIEVNVATVNSLQAQMACGEISKQDFCTGALAPAVDAVGGTVATFGSGLLQLSTVIEAQKTLREVKALCK